jgi:transcriptional regulator with XRE-family HTH domain
MSINSKMTQQSLKQLEEITGGPLTLGKLLLSIRQSEEMTQVEFGESLGMSKQQLSDIENNRKVVSPQLAASYADKLGYSPDQFVRLSLQQMLDRAGLDLSIEITPKSHGRRHQGGSSAYAT